ncbi:hypothetical protein WN55_03505 [Dufourea novaeangliae]|uniref:Uncharacterized protein n=1 Tax=Dufourea novaeangliae TaxID=178035 RepID=A0A154PL97_DUFNO|nr:hypothetical protein WN55_03505 [Dufourea novaeangliae]
MVQEHYIVTAVPKTGPKFFPPNSETITSSTYCKKENRIPADPKQPLPQIAIQLPRNE